MIHVYMFDTLCFIIFSFLYFLSDIDLTLSARDRLYTSEYVVYRRQILTYKDGTRTERIKISLMGVDP